MVRAQKWEIGKIILDFGRNRVGSAARGLSKEAREQEEDKKCSIRILSIGLFFAFFMAAITAVMPEPDDGDIKNTQSKKCEKS